MNTNITLDVIEESFEDVSLTYDPELKSSSQLYLNRPRPKRYLSNSNSTLTLNQSNSTSNLNKTYSKVFLNNNSNDLLLTPSQKYRINKKRKQQQDIQSTKNELKTNSPEGINTTDFLSDDDLPDDFIVYDVPFLRPLQSLSQHRKSIRRKNSISTLKGDDTHSDNNNNKENNNRNDGNNSSSSSNKYNASNNLPQKLNNHNSLSSTSSGSTNSSPATRASSIFSQCSEISDLSYFDDDSCLSKEVKLLSSNKDYKLEESLQRISMLKSLTHLNLSNSNFSVENLKDSDNNKVTNVISDLPQEQVPSKEKTHYLSNTRQPNLPPKDTYESLKHQRDYEHLVEIQIQNEKQDMERYEKLKNKSKLQSDKDYKLWKRVVENYDTLIKLPQTRELYWRNLPPNLRSTIWKRQLTSKKKFKADNELLTESLKFAENIIEKACKFKIMRNELCKKKFENRNLKFMDQIKNVDKYSQAIQFSFPDLSIFQIGSTFESILKVSIAFDYFKRDKRDLLLIDAERLINLICVLFYVFNNELITLNSFITIISKKLPLNLLTDNNVSSSLTEQLKNESKQSHFLKDTKNQFDKILLNVSPNLYNHFVQRDVNTLKIIQNVVSNLFTLQLNFEVTLRIIDLYLFEGDTFLLRCLLALLKKVNYKLYGSREEITEILGDACLKHLNKSIKKDREFVYLDVNDTEEFIQDIRKILKRK